MVYPRETILKVVASFSQFPRRPPSPKMPKILIFWLLCVEKVFKKVI